MARGSPVGSAWYLRNGRGCHDRRGVRRGGLRTKAWSARRGVDGLPCAGAVLPLEVAQVRGPQASDGGGGQGVGGRLQAREASQGRDVAPRARGSLLPQSLAL